MRSQLKGQGFRCTLHAWGEGSCSVPNYLNQPPNSVSSCLLPMLCVRNLSWSLGRGRGPERRVFVCGGGQLQLVLRRHLAREHGHEASLCGPRQQAAPLAAQLRQRRFSRALRPACFQHLRSVSDKVGALITARGCGHKQPQSEQAINGIEARTGRSVACL
jgi:hypothetical protein